MCVTEMAAANPMSDKLKMFVIGNQYPLAASKRIQTHNLADIEIKKRN